MKRIKKTKIIATLGPSSSSSERIEKLIKEGVDVLRINFSHSSHKEAGILIKEIRKLNQKLSANTSILADLQGPKLRIGEIKSKVTLIVGNKIKIKIQGIPSLSSFVFQSKNHEAYKTYITQEMLKKGFLATTTIYVSTSHTKKIINKYLKYLEKIFLIISKCERGDDIHRYLSTKVSETDFARLN